MRRSWTFWTRSPHLIPTRGPVLPAPGSHQCSFLGHPLCLPQALDTGMDGNKTGMDGWFWSTHFPRSTSPSSVIALMSPIQSLAGICSANDACCPLLFPWWACGLAWSYRCFQVLAHTHQYFSPSKLSLWLGFREQSKWGCSHFEQELVLCCSKFKYSFSGSV